MHVAAHACLEEWKIKYGTMSVQRRRHHLLCQMAASIAIGRRSRSIACSELQEPRYGQRLQYCTPSMQMFQNSCWARETKNRQNKEI